MNQTKSKKRSVSTKVAPLRFTHLILENWRNFQHVEVSIPQRLFVVGPNASGKSNFLDAFGFLHDLVAAGGGFRTAVSQSGGFQRLRFHSGKQHADVGITVHVGGEQKKTCWEYELRFNQDAVGQPIITRERVSHAGKALKVRPDREDSADRFRLGQTYLEQSGINKGFRPLADFFLSVEHAEIVPHLVRRWLFAAGRGRTFGATLLQELSRMGERPRDELLGEISSVLKEALPQLHHLTYRYDPLEKQPHLEAQFQDNLGPRHLENQLSDGTLRLFGLFFTLLRASGPLLVEEPDMSLHPAMVQLLPGIIARFQSRSGRQVIMTTHSPEMLRDEGVAPDEVLLLQPAPEGSSARLARDFREISSLLEAGVSLAESVPAMTSPS